MTMTTPDSVASRSTPGRPGLFLLTTPDPAAVAGFYRAMFGWELGADGVLTLAGEPVGAITTGEGGWLPYLTVTSLEDALVKVADAGGKVTAEPHQDPLGRHAVVVDPTDTPLGLWEAGSGVGTPSRSGTGSVVWIEQKTRGQDAATDFLASVFGVKAVGPQGPGKVRPLLGAGNPLFAGVMQFDDRWSADHPPHWLLYVEIDDDIQAMIDRAEQNGGSRWFPVTQTPLGALSYVRDPAGNAIAFVNVSDGGRAMNNPAGNDG